MPYKSIDELPGPLKEKLPKHAQSIYMAAFNASWPEHKDDATCAKIAWAAVKAKYHKDEKGEWVENVAKGGPGSGNFGHAGRPGEVGGSAPGGMAGGMGEGKGWSAGRKERARGYLRSLSEGQLNRKAMAAAKRMAKNFDQQKSAKEAGDTGRLARLREEAAHARQVYHLVDEAQRENAMTRLRSEHQAHAEAQASKHGVTPAWLKTATNPEIGGKWGELARLPSRLGDPVHYARNLVQAEMRTRLAAMQAKAEEPLTPWTAGELDAADDADIELLMSEPDEDAAKSDGFLARIVKLVKSLFAEELEDDREWRALTGLTAAKCARLAPEQLELVKARLEQLGMGIDAVEAVKGGYGSGNWGHAGRPGELGGSAPGGGMGGIAAAGKAWQDDLKTASKIARGVEDDQYSERELARIERDLKRDLDWYETDSDYGKALAIASRASGKQKEAAEVVVQHYEAKIAALRQIDARMKGLRTVFEKRLARGRAPSEPAMTEAELEAELAYTYPKAASDDVVGKSVSFISKDAKRQVAIGVVYEPYQVDTQGDWATPEEIEKACHQYMENYRKVGLRHDGKPCEDVIMVESYIAPQDLQLDGQKVVKGTWLMGVHAKDAKTWAEVESGELSGLSLFGKAQRTRGKEPTASTKDTKGKADGG